MSVLDPSEIANQVAEDLRKGGSTISVWNDAVIVPDEHWTRYAPTDRAILTFVGSREQIRDLEIAAHEILKKVKS